MNPNNGLSSITSHFVSPNLIHHYRGVEPTFEEPLALPQSRTVVLSSYFASRVDPTRCWQYTAGHLPRNSFSAFKPWYDAVERLGLTALVFHDDALSAEYASGSGTAAILFQKVTLGRLGWSLDDERWAVYHSWLLSPGKTQVHDYFFGI